MEVYSAWRQLGELREGLAAPRAETTKRLGDLQDICSNLDCSLSGLLAYVAVCAELSTRENAGGPEMASERVRDEEGTAP